jgi:hypothetical protein
MNGTPIAQQLEESIDKGTTKGTAKETVTRLKIQPIKWKKIYAIYRPNKPLIITTYRELK